MNNSQLLYKISNLQYSIRRKEIEYTNAVKAKDQHHINLNKEALMALKEDLAVTVKEFNSVPVNNADKHPVSPKKIWWWQSLFNIKTAINKKR
jgi:hypothetical protein